MAKHLYYYDQAFELGHWVRYWFTSRRAAEAARRETLRETQYDPDDDEDGLTGKYGDVTEVHSIEIPTKLTPATLATLLSYGDPNND